MIISGFKTLHTYPRKTSSIFQLQVAADQRTDQILIPEKCHDPDISADSFLFLLHFLSSHYLNILRGAFQRRFSSGILKKAENKAKFI